VADLAARNRARELWPIESGSETPA
jgi:hypothetical protein